MQTKVRRIALLHHTGCGNLGDDAIIDAVVSNIRKRWENAEITIFSMNPEDTRERHGIPSHPIRRYTWSSGQESAHQAEDGIKSWFAGLNLPEIHLSMAAVGELAFVAESYRILKSFDLMIVSGGGQLTERGGPWSFPYAICLWTLLAKRAGVKCVFLNVGAGPLNHPLSRFFVARSLRAAKYVSFRDKESQSLAAELKFAGPGHVFPDNVYGIEMEPSDFPAGEAGRTVVGVAPMPYPFSDRRKYPSNARAIEVTLTDKLAAFTSRLTQQSYNPVLFGSDMKADTPAIEELRRVLMNCHNISTPEYVPIESVSELLTRMSSMDYVVTCRFHGVVFAHLLNKPLLAIAHHPKVTHLMNALGLSKYCFDMDTFDPAQLDDAFNSLVDDRELVKEKLAGKLVEYRKKLALQFDELFPPEPGTALCKSSGSVLQNQSSQTEELTSTTTR